MQLQKQEEEEFEELVRRKYKLDEDKELCEMDYRERNKRLYDMLKRYQICVIPDVENLDTLPTFSIIETSLKDTTKKTRIKRQETNLNGGSPSQTDKKK